MNKILLLLIFFVFIASFLLWENFYTHYKNSVKGVIITPIANESPTSTPTHTPIPTPTPTPTPQVVLKKTSYTIAIFGILW